MLRVLRQSSSPRCTRCNIRVVNYSDKSTRKLHPKRHDNRLNQIYLFYIDQLIILYLSYLRIIMQNRSSFQAIAVVVVVGLLISNSLVDGLKPEIRHKFREPEKRPPIIVTTFFTALVASPALLLFLLWPKSVSLNFETLTGRRILFHSIFLLILYYYTKFWFGTNMFDTMRYIAPLTCLLFYVFKY